MPLRVHCFDWSNNWRGLMSCVRLRQIRLNSSSSKGNCLRDSGFSFENGNRVMKKKHVLMYHQGMTLIKVASLQINRKGPLNLNNPSSRSLSNKSNANNEFVSGLRVDRKSRLSFDIIIEKPA